MRDFDMAAFDRMGADGRKVALGFSPTAHLPAEGRYDPVRVHGIDLFCEAKGAVRGYKRQRVRATCPCCGKVFAAGNLRQHYDIHTESGRARLARKAARTAARRTAR